VYFEETLFFIFCLSDLVSRVSSYDLVEYRQSFVLFTVKSFFFVSVKFGHLYQRDVFWGFWRKNFCRLQNDKHMYRIWNWYEM